MSLHLLVWFQSILVYQRTFVNSYMVIVGSNHYLWKWCANSNSSKWLLGMKNIVIWHFTPVIYISKNKNCSIYLPSNFFNHTHFAKAISLCWLKTRICTTANYNTDYFTRIAFVVITVTIYSLVGINVLYNFFCCCFSSLWSFSSQN